MANVLTYPAVLFDLDGTLANSVDLIVASYRFAFDQVTGRQISRQEACSWIGQTLPQTFARQDPVNATSLEAAYRQYNNANFDQIEPYPGVDELVAALVGAGAVVGVVTAKGRQAAEETLRRVGLDGLITVLGARDDTPSHKPDPAPLLAALAKVGQTPKSAAYVGDAVFDVQAAQAAGMAAVAVTWGAGQAGELAALAPDAICRDADELAAVLFVT